MQCSPAGRSTPPSRARPTPGRSRARGPGRGRRARAAPGQAQRPGDGLPAGRRRRRRRRPRPRSPCARAPRRARRTAPEVALSAAPGAGVAVPPVVDPHRAAVAARLQPAHEVRDRRVPAAAAAELGDDDATSSGAAAAAAARRVERGRPVAQHLQQRSGDGTRSVAHRAAALGRAGSSAQPAARPGAVDGRAAPRATRGARRLRAAHGRRWRWRRRRRAARAAPQPRAQCRGAGTRWRPRASAARRPAAPPRSGGRLAADRVQRAGHDWPACSQVGQRARGRQRAAAQPVQQHAVAGEQVELAGRPARVVPVARRARCTPCSTYSSWPVTSVVTHVAPMWKPSSGGPYMPSTRESLSTTSVSRVERGELALRRPGRRTRSAPSRRRARRGRARRPSAGAARPSAPTAAIAVVDALEPDVRVALDEDPQRPVACAARRLAGGGRRPCRCRCARGRQRASGRRSRERVGDPARLGDEGDRQVERQRARRAARPRRGGRSGPRATARSRRSARRAARSSAKAVSHQVETATSKCSRARVARASSDVQPLRAPRGSQCGSSCSRASTSVDVEPVAVASWRAWATTTPTPPLSCRSLTRKATFTRRAPRAAAACAAQRAAPASRAPSRAARARRQVGLDDAAAAAAARRARPTRPERRGTLRRGGGVGPTAAGATGAAAASGRRARARRRAAATWCRTTWSSGSSRAARRPRPRPSSCRAWPDGATNACWAGQDDGGLALGGRLDERLDERGEAVDDLDDAQGSSTTDPGGERRDRGRRRVAVRGRRRRRRGPPPPASRTRARARGLGRLAGEAAWCSAAAAMVPRPLMDARARVPTGPAHGLRRPVDVLRGVRRSARGAHPVAHAFLEFRGGADAGAARRARSTASTPTWSSSSARRSSPPALSRACARGPSASSPSRSADGRGAPRHEDLERRLWELGQSTGRTSTAIVAFDPHIATTADAVLPVWRARRARARARALAWRH